MTIKHYAYAAGIAMSLVLFAACGDDVTEVTNVSENASLDQVKKFKELPKCEEDIEGTLVYVKDSAKVFGCTSDGWVRFNGLDGADGKNGSKGKDGMNCTAKQNKKKTGYDIVCDGKTIATIENGSDGKNGSDGDDGVNCTAKQNKKKTGIDVTCGDKTVTIPDGIDGADGAGCTFKEGENGAVKVTCGEGADANSLTLFKAICGNNSFDPETQFCFKEPDHGELYVGDRCKYRNPVMVSSEQEEGEPVKEDFFDEVYDPRYSFCDGSDSLRQKCRVVQSEGDTVWLGYDYENEYCDGSTYKIRALASCVKGDKKSPKYQPEYQYCYKTKLAKGIQIAYMPQCGSDNRYYNPRTDYCTLKKSGKGELHDTKVCTQSGKVKDSLNIDVRYTGEDDFQGRGSICDTRDYQVYKYTTINNMVWMAQNLNYTDEHMNRRTAKSDIRLNSTSFCYNNDATNCDKYGRLYTWSAAIDSVALDSGKNAIVCGYGAEGCFDKPNYIKGICPDGWRLPVLEEVARLEGNSQIYMVNDLGSLFSGTKLEDIEWNLNGAVGTNASGFAALPSGFATFKYEDDTWTWGYSGGREHMAIWTTTEFDDSNLAVDPPKGRTWTKAYMWYIANSNESPSYGPVEKYHAFSVRCVRDDAE